MDAGRLLRLLGGLAGTLLLAARAAHAATPPPAPMGRAGRAQELRRLPPDDRGPGPSVHGSDEARLWVKLDEASPAAFESSGLVCAGRCDAGSLAELRSLLSHARPRFAGRARASTLGRYLVLDTPGPGVVDALVGHPWVEHVRWAVAPVPPPQEDLPPATPSFVEEQTYVAVGPEGLGWSDASQWPRAPVRLADVEYGWEQDHEDLELGSAEFSWGVAVEPYTSDFAFHGTGVLGILGALDNDYGMTGVAPDAELLVVSPFDALGAYDPAAAIAGAADLLAPGDVLLVEQQGWWFGTYGPVEYDPGAFDAILEAVERGVVVVEPAGNGACDLDDSRYDGWFDRGQRDSGAILVGGGASWAESEPRSTESHSCFGSRVDLQAWAGGVATLSSSGGADDLFGGGGDPRQAYTANFNGTSSASALVAGLVAEIQAVAWAVRGEPWAPLDLRSALASLTWAAPEGERAVGGQPDLRRWWRTWGPR